MSVSGTDIPAEGNYCALRDKDGGFYRVRILKFSRPLEFMFHHREKAKVLPPVPSLSPTYLPLFSSSSVL